MSASSSSSHSGSKQPYTGPDFVEAMDVAKVHAEELTAPTEGNNLPLNTCVILSIVVAIVFVLAESYFGSSMAFSSTVLEGQVASRGGAGGAGGGDAAAAALPPEVLFYNAGKKGYALNCAMCHQPTGLGAAGQFPPLAGSEWVTGSDHRLAAILLHSIQGPLVVKGVQWNNAGMPQWGKTLTDVQIAQIMTFIRGNKDWGNTAPAVTPETVKAVRDKYATRAAPWTQLELDKETWDAAP